MPKRIDLTGKKVGMLTVIKEAGRDKYGKLIWLCHCDCGKYKEIRGDQLTGGRAISCGCQLEEIRRSWRTGY